MAESEYPDHRLLVYSLDRFEKVERTDEHYDIPEGFDIQEYYSISYGVSDVKSKPELIRFRVNASQVNYFRTLPLHPSQKEEETTDEYSVFTCFVIPTYEYRQEILSHGANVEVLSPASLREKIKGEIENMNKLYM